MDRIAKTRTKRILVRFILLVVSLVIASKETCGQVIRNVDLSQAVVSELPQGDSDGYYRLAVSPDGKYLAARDRSNKVDLFDLNRETFIARFEGNANWVTAMAFSPDSKLLIAMGEGSGGRTLCWEISTGRQLFALDQGGDAMSLSKDGQYLRLASQGVILTYEIPSGRALKPKAWGDADDVAIALSTEGQFTVTHRKITNQIARTQLIDLGSGSTIVFDGPADLARSVAISSDEHWIAAVYHHSQKITWWNRTAPREIRFEVSHHQKNLHTVNFTWDSRWLIATSWDGTCSVWEAATGQQVCVLSGHGGRVMSTANDPIRERILTSAVGLEDHRVLAWRIQDILLDQVDVGNYDTAQALQLLSSPELSSALPALAKLLRDDEQTWLDSATQHLQLDVHRDSKKGLEAVEQLNSRSFAERIAATHYLATQQDWVRQLLGGADGDSFSPEQRYRLEKILNGPKSMDAISSEQSLFASRLILLLEWKNSASSVQLLQLITRLHRDSRVMSEALAAMQRLEVRNSTQEFLK